MVMNRLSYSGPGNDPFDNATLRRAREATEQAQGLLRQAQMERMEIQRLMSQALWCDIGNHAFSAKDRAKRSIAMTRWDEDKQADVEDSVMSCGPCATVNPLIQAAQPDKPVSSAAIGAPSTSYDANYTKRLEQELGVGQQPTD
jgi:hypothetical protein